MKKFLIALLLGISLLTLVSCQKASVDQANIPNKYPIDEYLKKGATLQEYTKSGTALMKDTKGQKFFVASNSTYEPLLTNDGALMSLIVVNKNVYYYDYVQTETTLPDNFKKSGISFFSGNNKELTGETDSYKFAQSATAYINKDDTSTIYLKIKDKDEYQVWKTYKDLNTK